MAQDPRFTASLTRLEELLRHPRPSARDISDELCAFPVLREHAISMLATRPPKPRPSLLRALLGAQPAPILVHKLAQIWTGQLHEALVAAMHEPYTTLFFTSVLKEMSALPDGISVARSALRTTAGGHEAGALLDRLAGDSHAPRKGAIRALRRRPRCAMPVTETVCAWSDAICFPLNALMAMFEARPQRVLHLVRRAGAVNAVAGCIIAEATARRAAGLPAGMRSGWELAEVKCAFLAIVKDEWEGSVEIRGIPASLRDLTQHEEIISGVNEYLRPLVDVKSHRCAQVADLGGILAILIRVIRKDYGLFDAIQCSFPACVLQDAMLRVFEAVDLTGDVVIAVLTGVPDGALPVDGYTEAVLLILTNFDVFITQVFCAMYRDDSAAKFLSFLTSLAGVAVYIAGTARARCAQGLRKVQAFFAWLFMRGADSVASDWDALREAIGDRRDGCLVTICRECRAVHIDDRARYRHRAVHVVGCKCALRDTTWLPDVESWALWECLYETCIASGTVHTNRDWLGWLAAIDGARQSPERDTLRMLFTGLLRGQFACVGEGKIPAHVTAVMRAVGSKSGQRAIDWLFSTIAVFVSQGWSDRRSVALRSFIERLLVSVPKRLLFAERGALSWSEVVHAESIMGVLFTDGVARSVHECPTLSIYAAHVWDIGSSIYEWDRPFANMQLISACAVTLHRNGGVNTNAKRKHTEQGNVCDKVAETSVRIQRAFQRRNQARDRVRYKVYKGVDQR